MIAGAKARKCPGSSSISRKVCPLPLLVCFSIHSSSRLSHLSNFFPLPHLNSLLHLHLPFSFSQLVELSLVYLDQTPSPVIRWHIVLRRQNLYIDHGLHMVVHRMSVDVARYMLFPDMMDLGYDVLVGHRFQRWSVHVRF